MSDGTIPTADEVARLHARIDELEGRTKLLSKSFWTRAFAAYGLVFVSGMCIAIPIYALGLIFVLLSGRLNP